MIEEFFILFSKQYENHFQKVEIETSFQIIMFKFHNILKNIFLLYKIFYNTFNFFLNRKFLINWCPRGHAPNTMSP